MDRYGPQAPEGDDRPPSQSDPLAYWDDIPKEAKDLQRNIVRGYVSGNTSDALATVDFGQLLEDIVVLIGLAIRGAFLLVTWPIRWLWRRTRS